jgi:hypothetical protein
MHSLLDPLSKKSLVTLWHYRQLLTVVTERGFFSEVIDEDF